jgi:Flp pilus assembly protein TadD
VKKLLVSAAACAFLAAQALPSAALASETSTDHVDVAYQALSEGRTAEAIAQLDRSAAIETSDPAALINLGTAYARQGRVGDARAAFAAALHSKEHYFLELADGRWVDSRKAAKMALMALEADRAVALR